MDINLFLLGFLLFTSSVVDDIVLGIAGYVVYRLLGFPDQKWWIGGLILAFLFYIWDLLRFGQLDNVVEWKFKNQEVAKIIGDDFGTVDLTGFIVSVVTVLIGFFVGRKIVKMLMERMQGL